MDNRPQDFPYRNISTGGFPGSHLKHLPYPATPAHCEKCHPGSTGYASSHRDGQIRVSSRINNSLQSTSYNNMTSSFPQTATPVPGSCTNVNCHFENTTPVWGSTPPPSPTDCNRCHGAPPSGGATGAAGSHARHETYSSVTGRCASCHPDHTAEPRPFAHATSAGRRDLVVAPHDPLGVSGGSYSGPVDDFLPSRSNIFGSCSGLYCHSNAAPFDKANTPASPVWGSGPLACNACHDQGGDASTLSGRHARHTGGAYAFSCERCHYGTVTDSSAIKSTVLHVNKVKDVTFRETGSYNAGTRGCTGYCHSNAAGGAPTMAVNWSDTSVSMTCYSCHKGRLADNTVEDCARIGGTWDAAKGYCTPFVNMTSNGHSRLVGPQWVRKYPCTYCHNATVDAGGNISDYSRHLNGTKDVAFSAQWAIAGQPAPSYAASTKVCANIYCHSDGTTDPETVRPFAWTEKKTACNTCHGHTSGSCGTSGCHDGLTVVNNRVLPIYTRWSSGQEWRAAMPMFPNQGAGTSRANSHPRHMQTNFTCDNCHVATIKNGTCTDCHALGLPLGSMNEVSHIDPAFHVNKNKDVTFKDGGSYNLVSKSCSNTKCHTGGADPVWGGSVNNLILCINCHGTSGADIDDFGSFNNIQAKINLNQWTTSGHGRYSSATLTGRYPVSGNRAANFPGNPCWYCHDNNVLHKDTKNPFRLRQHAQFTKRFEKECVFCHMEGKDSECLGCHNAAESLAPQLSTITTPHNHTGYTGGGTSCVTSGCHPDDASRHKTNSGIWTAAQKADVRNQYVMMGVCLQCHDDDSGGRCTSCHTAPPSNPNKYSLGFDPGTGFIKPVKARASSVHFGYKHYRAYQQDGVWKGGKFCWDCHDPHGDSNIYMIQSKVATTTDGSFGIPLTRADVVFTGKVDGTSYVQTTSVNNTGLCNVCHSATTGKHYRSNGGDSHNIGRVCTTCHEHRFTDSHANKQSCNTCHKNRPVPRHTAFGLPRDCTKCHAGTIGGRMDIMGQIKANSHHVQGVEVTNKHCYACHWEATKDGLINVTYHGGFNFNTYSSVKKDYVDLVLWGPGIRPTTYREYSTASGRASTVRYLASNIGTAAERTEVAKLTNVCLACHSDQNNDTTPFDDCKTPIQYAWDRKSIATRYSQTGKTSWSTYSTANSSKKKRVVKAFSAHGNAVNNAGGGWSATPGGTGQDGILTNTRAGTNNVQCYDCHSSHGSKVVGTTTSYSTFNGTKNGGNLKETQAGKGGYTYAYKAAANPAGINPYSAGAGQCFDCHESLNAGTTTPNGQTPWGYSATFGATAPIMGYKDTPRFGDGVKASTSRFAHRDSKKTIMGGHLKASEPPGSLPNLAKDTGTATSGSTTTIGAAKNWAVDAWKNLYALVTSGANSGQARRIEGNSATQLTVEPFAYPVAAGDTYKIVPYSTTIDGLCTPCHDPHGVSPVLGADQAYAVPLLKGTWMTSFYKEDAPPPDPSGSTARYAPYGVSTPVTGNLISWGDGRLHANHPEKQPVTNYNIDRTTLGGATRIAEKDSQFAGLCLGCHKKEVLTDGITKNNGSAGFKTKDRVHESVSGWGANTEHSYTCSKCHQPHNSGLPRLMQTNCLDAKHRGQRASGGLPWAADKQVPVDAHGLGSEHRGYPIGSTMGGRYSGTEATTACHVSRFPLTYNSGTPPAEWPDQNLWNTVTPW